MNNCGATCGGNFKLRQCRAMDSGALHSMWKTIQIDCIQE